MHLQMYADDGYQISRRLCSAILTCRLVRAGGIDSYGIGFVDDYRNACGKLWLRAGNLMLGVALPAGKTATNSWRFVMLYWGCLVISLCVLLCHRRCGGIAVNRLCRAHRQLVVVVNWPLPVFQRMRASWRMYRRGHLTFIRRRLGDAGSH